MSKCKLYKNTDSVFNESLNTNNSQLYKELTLEPELLIEACNV